MSPPWPPCNLLAAPVSGAGDCGTYKALTIALSSQTATSRCRVTFWKLTLAANIGFLSKTAVNKWERNKVSSGIWIEVNVSNTTHLIKRLTSDFREGVVYKTHTFIYSLLTLSSVLPDSALTMQEESNIFCHIETEKHHICLWNLFNLVSHEWNGPWVRELTGERSGGPWG